MRLPLSLLTLAMLLIGLIGAGGARAVSDHAVGDRAVSAGALDGLPAPWREAPAEQGWRSVGLPGEPAFTSMTRVDGDSTLTLPFPVTDGPVEVSFTATAPPVAGRRGVNFGLGWFRPALDAYRAALLTFGGGGQVVFWDAGGFFNVGAYRPGRRTSIRMVIDPRVGAFTIEVDGKPGPGLIPFYAGIPRIDSLFFTNSTTRAEDSPIRIDTIRAGAYSSPSSPGGVMARALLPTEAEVAWAPAAGASRYRVYRAGRRVAEVAAGLRHWAESGLPEGRPVAYSVTAVDGDGRESLPGWPVATLLPLPEREKRIPRHYDVVVVGGTPAGIAASLAAARRGLRVLLAVPSGHLGGMMSGGLGRTDFRYPAAQGGIFKEFTSRVERYYEDAYGPGSRTAQEAGGGYNFEAGGAEAIFRRMLDEEPRIVVRSGLTPVGAQMKRERVAAVDFRDPEGRRERIPARTFIDATYAGDLLPLAGVAYRVGREARADYGEEHAGVIYWDVDRMTFLPGSTGEGDRRVQAYNYRLPLTNRAGDREYRMKPPEGYDRSQYATIPEDVRAGRIHDVNRVLNFRRVPGEEFDVNNHRYWPSTDYVGHSDDYPDSSPERREAIAEATRRYTEGLVYFLQNDPELPAGFRFDANQWGLSENEFAGNGHFPTQLYVREARRMVGEYTFSERDARLASGAERTPTVADSIAVGDYMMDSHATRPQEPDRPMGVLEGFFFIPAITKPYQIPYRILAPDKVDGLLVPVAVSATHVGYGTLRMEPVMMEMGEAAGAAAALARRRKVSARAVPLRALQLDLLRSGAVLTFFDDLSPARPDFEAFQYLGTLGLFPDYSARPDRPIDRPTAEEWLRKSNQAIGRRAAEAESARLDAMFGRPALPTRGEVALRLFRDLIEARHGRE